MTSGEQARADAMADAETLRLIGRPFALGNAVTASKVLDIHNAGIMGTHAADNTRWLHADRAREYAREAARAAFRAVPALRGEE